MYAELNKLCRRRTSRVQTWVGSRLSSIGISGGPESMHCLLLVVSPTQVQFVGLSSASMTLMYGRKEPKKKQSSKTSTKKSRGSEGCSILSPKSNQKACQQFSALRWISSSPSPLSSQIFAQYFAYSPANSPHTYLFGMPIGSRRSLASLLTLEWGSRWVSRWYL